MAAPVMTSTPATRHRGRQAAAVALSAGAASSAGAPCGGLDRLCEQLDGFGLNSWARALAGARPAERADAARAAASKCEADLALPGMPEASAAYTGLPAELRGWASQHEAALHATGSPEPTSAKQVSDMNIADAAAGEGDEDRDHRA